MKSKSTKTHKQQKVSNQVLNTKNTKTGIRPANVHFPVLTVSKSNENAKTFKQYKSTGKPHTNKVSATNHQILCQNRFASLYLGDGVVSHGDNEVSIPLPQKNVANSDHVPTNQASKASLCDAHVQHASDLDQLSQRILFQENGPPVAAASGHSNTVTPGTHCRETIRVKGQNDTVKSIKK